MSTMEREDIRRRIRRLLVSFIKLGLVLLALTLMDAAFGGIIFEVFNLSLDSSEILGIFRLIAIIYYGYWVLKDSLFFLNILSGTIARKFELEGASKPRRVGLDTLYLISLGLGWLALSPFLRALPDLAVRAISLAFLLMAFIFIYDLVSTVYSMVKGGFESLVDTLSELVRRELSKESGEE